MSAPFKSSARMRLQPRPKAPDAETVTMPGKVELAFVNLDNIVVRPDGQLEADGRILQPNPAVPEPEPTTINVRSPQ